MAMEAKVKFPKLRKLAVLPKYDEIREDLRGRIHKWGYAHLVRSDLDRLLNSFEDSEHESLCEKLALELTCDVEFRQFMITFTPLDTKKSGGLVIAGSHNPTIKELKENAKRTAKLEAKH